MPRPTGLGWTTILVCIALGLVAYYRTEIAAKLAEITSHESPDP